jgi:3'(2'), 5'-bisphosphate nucleotidase
MIFLEKEPTLVNKGSSLKFMTIAQGDADLYPRMAPTMEWDTCAAQIILEEAGGSVMIEGSNNEPVVYNKEILKNPYFIAKGKEVF